MKNDIKIILSTIFILITYIRAKKLVTDIIRTDFDVFSFIPLLVFTVSFVVYTIECIVYKNDRDI